MCQSILDGKYLNKGEGQNLELNRFGQGIQAIFLSYLDLNLHLSMFDDNLTPLTT